MTRAVINHHVKSLQEMESLAQRVAARAEMRDVIALHGEMGAGKSVFARAFIRARAQDPTLDVPSPSFALVQIYELKTGTVAHYDLWRLTDPEGVHEIGWEVETPQITIIEWPENAGAYLPMDALHIFIRATQDAALNEDALWVESGAREVEFRGWGDRTP